MWISWSLVGEALVFGLKVMAIAYFGGLVVGYLIPLMRWGYWLGRKVSPLRILENRIGRFKQRKRKAQKVTNISSKRLC